MRLKTALEGLDGIVCIADDILVFGEGNDYAEAERDMTDGSLPCWNVAITRTLN